MGRVKRIWYLSPMRAAKVQASLRIRAVSPEPPLLAHTSSESRGTFRQKARSLAPLNGWACAVKICHDGMLEDTNSLDAAQVKVHIKWFNHSCECGRLSVLDGMTLFGSVWRCIWTPYQNILAALPTFTCLTYTLLLHILAFSYPGPLVIGLGFGPLMTFKRKGSCVSKERNYDFARHVLLPCDSFRLLVKPVYDAIPRKANKGHLAMSCIFP